MITRLLHWLGHFSIRGRLLSAYVGILLGGFAILTILAGNQIAGAARTDYEQRMLNEIQLIVQGIAPYFKTNTPSTELEQLLAEYETQVNGTIVLHSLERNKQPNDRNSFFSAPEIETAIRHEVIVAERLNEDGQPALYTAAMIDNERDHPEWLVQLQVPLDNLQWLITQRWLALGGVFLLVLSMAFVAALLIAQSIIVPLNALRYSAQHLSEGNLAHRILPTGSDEISIVALAFNEMAAQVQRMLDEQRAFASNTSHELRTPLTTIRLRSEALLYDTTLDEATTQQYISEIDEEVRRLGVLVEDLALLSRLDAGRAELHRHEIDLKRFMQNLCFQMQPRLAAKQIMLHQQLPEQDLIIQGSLNYLQVVFRNLLDNAIKYTPPQGQITWEITATEHEICTKITDTGQGIAPEDLPHVFERFYRADKARSRNVPGTGLGLALVQSIVRAYQGTVSITSGGLQQGTTVMVSLPKQ